jgi:hypothetical protein
MTPRKDTAMRNLALVAAGLALVGCAATPTEADYGHSFKQMTENQVYNRATLSKPSAAPVEVADPNVINLAVQSLRAEKVDRSQVSQPMTINIGQSGQ